jgi:hypothetical protein
VSEFSRLARRGDEAYREYGEEPQRSQTRKGAARMVRYLRRGTLAAASLVVACGSGPGDGGPISTAADAQQTIKQFCVECHNPIDWSGELSFDRVDPGHVGDDPAVWERVVRKLRTRTMPPIDARRPDNATYESLAAWLEDNLDSAAPVNPGEPALRRLNRAEYANAIRDLLNLQIDVASLLPPDDSAYGFDNNGDLLVVSPSLLERYLSAADRVSALAIGDQETVAGAQTYTLAGDQSQSQHIEGLPLGTVGGLAVEHNFPLDGEYEFQIALIRTNLEDIRGLEHPHHIEIAVDGERVLLEEIGGAADRDRPGTTITERSDVTDARLHVRVPVEAGARTVTATFIRKIGAGTDRLRPFDRSTAGTYDSTGRPHVESLTVTGPFSPTSAGETLSRQRVFSCRPQAASEEEACAREILTKLAAQAYRRPVDETDIARLMPFYSDGRAKGSFDSGIQLALRRILASPSFVFRVEEDPADVAAGGSYFVSDIELASRLSFFLWSSLPDATLIELAAARRLHESDVLREQVLRMLADPRSSALVENFAGQWLHLRNLENIKPNTDAFPDFDNNLRQAFRRETELLFASIVAENRSVVDLLSADYTFVDERLARHYGIPNVYGSSFRRVELGPELDARRGLLGKGGILMATSHADRTAPTLRGKWVMENLLGTPPPPPPPNVPGLEAEPGAAPRTMRERMESHRASPNCASCHALMDPLGFSMENFDAVGGWRDLEAGARVDASGRLADGTAIDGVIQLRDALVADPRPFATIFTEKLMTYAFGRGLQHYDMPILRAILRGSAADDYRIQTIVLGIVQSAPFRMRLKADQSDLLAQTQD